MGMIVPGFYKHVQEQASAIWTIVHNASGAGATLPVVDTYVDVAGVLTKTLPSNVNVIDVNTVELVFSQPRTGIALIII